MPEDKLIVITPGHTLDKEADLWMQLLDAGVGRVHIRKPNMKAESVLGLMTKVPSAYREQISIHYYPEVTLETEAGGLHQPYSYLINGRVLLPARYRLSASVHNWDEAHKAMKLCSYCFISPVFNSISKKGYNANPDLKNVPEQFKGNKIYALGGIDIQNAAEALNMGYYGLAVMGTIWEEPELAVDKAKALIQVINRKSISS
ncbi:thiamine phosphate synthase [Fulvivirga ulvae]|uniref:thiamine phosphate synthase n=1 Tax=Fulvivirga ulvae TaxID=2904245 RepID=UPI001F2D2032|nr:thiamine phosphate synthase [Fulvivirga ulvae]UII30055.1 thiamine phosphate synthase [Fulvivirga ulvae]